MTPAADQDQFLALLDAHHGILHKVANTYADSPEDRADLIQDMAIQLWRALNSFDGRCKPSTWVYRIALNVALSFRRHEHAHRHVISGDEHLLHLPDTTEPPPTAEQAFLRHFIEGLPGLDRAVLLLYMEDQGHQEIAEVLGITPTNVATKIHRLKQRLRDAAAS